MPVDLGRRRRESRLHSLEFAGLAIAAPLSLGLLAGAAISVVLFIVTAFFAPDSEPPIDVFVGIPLIAGAVFALAYLPMLAWAALRSGKIVLGCTEARAPDPLVEKTLSDVLEELSVAAHLPCPKAAIIDDDFPNAMTAGRGSGDATVVVTTGLLSALNRQELQAVVAHELAHIADGDIRFMTFMAALTRQLESDLSLVLDAYGVSILSPVVWPSAGLIRQAIKVGRMGASHEREFLADDTAVALTRDPRALASALVKIASTTATPNIGCDEVSMLFIVDPRHTWSGGESPPLRERVDRLRRLTAAPGDPTPRVDPDGATLGTEGAPAS